MVRRVERVLEPAGMAALKSRASQLYLAVSAYPSLYYCMPEARTHLVNCPILVILHQKLFGVFGPIFNCHLFTMRYWYVLIDVTKYPDTRQVLHPIFVFLRCHGGLTQAECLERQKWQYAWNPYNVNISLLLLISMALSISSVFQMGIWIRSRLVKLSSLNEWWINLLMICVDWQQGQVINKLHWFESNHMKRLNQCSLDFVVFVCNNTGSRSRKRVRSNQKNRSQQIDRQINTYNWTKRHLQHQDHISKIEGQKMGRKGKVRGVVPRKGGAPEICDWPVQPTGQSESDAALQFPGTVLHTQKE